MRIDRICGGEKVPRAVAQQVHKVARMWGLSLPQVFARMGLLPQLAPRKRQRVVYGGNLHHEALLK